MRVRVVVVVGLLVLSSGCELVDPAERAYLVGLRAEKGEATADPLASYDRAIALKPGEARYYEARAGLRARRGQPALALLDYTQALALLAPGDVAHRPALLRARAECLSTLGDPAAALRDVDEGLAIRADEPQLLAGRALALLVAGRAAEALAAIDRAIAAAPRFQPLRYQRGVVLARLGRRAEAVAQFAATVGVTCAGAGGGERALTFDGERQLRRVAGEPLVPLFLRGYSDSDDPRLRCAP